MFSIALRLACASMAIFLHAAHAAANDDTINPDRPGVGESSRTVGPGHVQLETGVQWERLRDDAAHARTLSTPALLRIGLGDSAELRVETDGRNVMHASEPSTGARARLAGYADTSAGVKWHWAEQAGARPAVGLLMDAALPSGSRALRGKGVRPSLSVPMEWELDGGWDFAAMPGVGVDSDDAGARYRYALLAATLGREIAPRLHAFAEVAAPRIARAAHGGTQVLVDTGVTWLVNKDCQIDAMLMHGLNHRTPDLGMAFGISIRH